MKGSLKVVDIMNQQQQCGDTIDATKIVLGKVIGLGSYAVVRKGSDNNQTVAGYYFVFVAKVLDFSKIRKEEKEHLMKYFEKEASLWQNLDHPNITKMIGSTMSMKTDYCLDKNKKSIGESNFCILSEYATGGSLRSYLSKNQSKKLPMKNVIQFALDIAKGYLHSKKIIHCDVKPENMLINAHHMIKLADFGESVYNPSEVMLIGCKSGTLGYMAPEVMSKKPFGPKCDVFAFGICLWEIYFRKMAYTYDLENITEEIYEIIRPSIPFDCPKRLARLMERFWDTDPKKRPNMKDVVVELEEIREIEEQQTISKNH
ncbi:serine/threonine-protein kinase 52-like [Rutidosis leptorrhynchoides]|uniref:serine/threonine-protein kinase 52-like n=1 Tax=Rutidosis leptorrhynchoides TaxID=125765 RepID=UPI003A997E14